MKNLYYPVLFHHEETGFSAVVPDLEGCFTQGDTLDETLDMVQDAIGLYLEDLEAVPKPSEPDAICVPDGDFVMAVPFDALAYQRRHNKKAVKKTLTIPGWLNEAAEAAHINFSSVLQEGLKKQLGL